MDEENFKIQSLLIKNLPTYISYTILKILQSNYRVLGTLKTLLGGLQDTDQIWFLEVCMTMDLSLHDLIGHVKRAGDSGELKTKLLTVVNDIRNSYHFQLEKRVEAIENKVKYITIS